MNLISKKMIMAVMLVATSMQVAVAQSWIRYSMPSTIADGYSPNNVFNCDADSKGTLWYTIPKGGLYSQTPDKQSWKNYPSLPVDTSAARMGIFVDHNTDSVYVGSIGGKVWSGKNGVFHALPSIPLLYTLNIPGDPPVSMTNVSAFVIAKGHKLVAATDSMAWWLNVDHWEPIGLPEQYNSYEAYYSEAVLDLDSSIWIGGGGSLTHITSDYKIDSIPGVGNLDVSPDYGLTVGPDGTIYGGTMDQYVGVRRPSNYALDSIVVQQPGEAFAASYSASAVFADKNGWVWIPQDGRIFLTHGDSIKAEWGWNPLSAKWDSIPKMRMPIRMLMAPDSNLWLCTANEVMRYYTKYEIPAKALGATATVSRLITPSNITTSLIDGGIRIVAAGTWSVHVYSISGNLAWQGTISENQDIQIGRGSWIVQGQNAQGKIENKLVAVIR